MISGQIPVSQNGMSSWGTISPHTPAEEKTFQFINRKPPVGLMLITRFFFFSVFLFPSFSWITFHPDSLPWPVLTTCRLEESPCDRTGKISIPLHNAPSDLWVSKLGKKALDRVFRSNEKLLTSQTGTPQGDLVFKADAIISWKKTHWTGFLQYLFGLTKSLLIQNLSFISSLENKTKPTKPQNFFR